MVKRNSLTWLKYTIILFFFFVLHSQSLSQTLLLFGGPNHDVFLGCLTCNKYDSESVWNKYGQFGNKYNPKSIWHKYGTYGNRYKQYSPWNKYSTDPPVVVDYNGNFYGYFTINRYKSNRAEFDLALKIYDYHEYIIEDVGAWYGKIF